MYLQLGSFEPGYFVCPKFWLSRCKLATPYLIYTWVSLTHHTGTWHHTGLGLRFIRAQNQRFLASLGHLSGVRTRNLGKPLHRGWPMFIITKVNRIRLFFCNIGENRHFFIINPRITNKVLWCWGWRKWSRLLLNSYLFNIGMCRGLNNYIYRKKSLYIIRIK